MLNHICIRNNYLRSFSFIKDVWPVEYNAPGLNITLFMGLLVVATLRYAYQSTDNQYLCTKHPRSLLADLKTAWALVRVLGPYTRVALSPAKLHLK